MSFLLCCCLVIYIVHISVRVCDGPSVGGVPSDIPAVFFSSEGGVPSDFPGEVPAVPSSSEEGVPSDSLGHSVLY